MPVRHNDHTPVCGWVDEPNTSGRNSGSNLDEFALWVGQEVVSDLSLALCHVSDRTAYFSHSSDRMQDVQGWSVVLAFSHNGLKCRMMHHNGTLS